ncbi:MAG: hypothetical protein AB7R90_04975 [Reyranellaceae bacterium]
MRAAPDARGSECESWESRAVFLGTAMRRQAATALPHCAHGSAIASLLCRNTLIRREVFRHPRCTTSTPNAQPTRAAAIVLNRYHRQKFFGRTF